MGRRVYIMKLLRVLKETFLASLPLAAIIMVVCGFIAPMDTLLDYIKLVIGYAGVVIGQSIFLVGLDISILPIGKAVGESLVKFKKVIFIIFFGFLFGFLAESAEPALLVFSGQVSEAMRFRDASGTVINLVHSQVLVIVMASGIGCFVGFGLFRILKNMSIKIVFCIFYAAIFLIAVTEFVPDEFIGIAFDGSGATTGDISVPFMLAMGIGVSATLSKRKSNDDTFGIIGIASIGPVIAVFLYGIIFRASHGGNVPVPNVAFNPFGEETFTHLAQFNLRGVALALLPIVLVFIPFQIFLIKSNKRDFVRILLGVIPVFVGLFIFLTCVEYGFAQAGKHVGMAFFADKPDWFKWLLLVVGFILGGAITLSEPAVTVLGHQIEEITNGHIRQMTIRLTLAIGLGFASVLSIVKIITQIDLLWFLIPLYAVALIMMKFSSKMFVGLAFDSGGVTAGGLSSAFLTPFALGIAQAVIDTGIPPALSNAVGGESLSILRNGFGIIAFMSVMPLIAVQTLGVIYELKFKRLREQMDRQELMELETLANPAGSAQSKPLEIPEGNNNG